MAETFKEQQLTEQSTASPTFVDVAGTTLTFTPDDTGDIWVVFATGKMRSSSTAEQSCEMRLVINGTEEDLWSHQNNNAGTPNGAGFFSFERITGTVALQTVKLQFRAITGTVYANQMRVVVARLPAGADFQYFESNGIVSTTGTNVQIGQLQFVPSSAGDYVCFGTVKHREFPNGSTSQAWFEDVGTATDLHPDSPAGTHHSNARDAWNPLTSVCVTALPVGKLSFNIRFTSSGAGAASSEHRYRKLMLFRTDVWDAFTHSMSEGQSTTTSASFQLKNSLAVAAPPAAREFLTIQTARIGGDNSTTAQKSGELRAGGAALMRTDHHINRGNDAAQGYHHIVSVVDAKTESSAVTYDNGFLSPNGITVACADSIILAFRYGSGGPGPAAGINAPFHAMVA